MSSVVPTPLQMLPVAYKDSEPFRLTSNAELRKIEELEQAFKSKKTTLRMK